MVVLTCFKSKLLEGVIGPLIVLTYVCSYTGPLRPSYRAPIGSAINTSPGIKRRGISFPAPSGTRVV